MQHCVYGARSKLEAVSHIFNVNALDREYVLQRLYVSRVLGDPRLWIDGDYVRELSRRLRAHALGIVDHGENHGVQGGCGRFDARRILCRVEWRRAHDIGYEPILLNGTLGRLGDGRIRESNCSANYSGHYVHIYRTHLDE